MAAKDSPEELNDFFQYMYNDGFMPNTHINGKTFGNEMKKVLTTTITNISKLDSWKELSFDNLLGTFWRTFELDVFKVQKETGPDVYRICDWWFLKIRRECMTDPPIDTIMFQKVRTTIAETLRSQHEKVIKEWCDSFFDSMRHHLTSLSFEQSSTPITEISPKGDNAQEGRSLLYTSNDWAAAWKHPYKGNALSHLELKLRLNIESMRGGVGKRSQMSRIIPIVQSSGAGKSRLAEEFNPLHCIANRV
jgi:hypothetical protein